MAFSTNSTSPATVTAGINYAVAPADGSRAYVKVTPNPNYRTEVKEVVVENVRGKEGQYNLDNVGFQWIKSPAKHTSFENDQDIKQEYYAESIELLKKQTGASKVVIFDHTIRRRRPDQVDTPGNRQPANGAHIDQTTKASIARRLKKRFQIINLWRPISHPAWEWPLALCDYRSADLDKDVLPGETFGVKFNPKHKWKYLRGMTPEEVVLIKCFDSVQDGSVAVFTPHTAFEDPTSPADAPLRESIELRALVFYD
ncbi:hypothetical protein DFP72DRAFT_903861 [Ephemerocybe angulata]|uniref:Methyltransferase n=1 Tax=Ephemerocybe angulata TaxID=980116 RepID=A0A8H6HV39_9AGAR|nr:hypothetical protein DFP72DRAFT_903861 [Tulosesus angulatus]